MAEVAGLASARDHYPPCVNYRSLTFRCVVCNSDHHGSARLGFFPPRFTKDNSVCGFRTLDRLSRFPKKSTHPGMQCQVVTRRQSHEPDERLHQPGGQARSKP